MTNYVFLTDYDNCFVKTIELALYVGLALSGISAC